MMTKEEYKREVVRMWDNLRKDHKGEQSCEGVKCRECPFRKNGECISDSFEVVETVEEWSKEHKEEKKKIMNKEEYKKELIRMWDSLRTDCQGLNNCNCVNCEKCPLSELGKGCHYISNDFERIEIVEKWSKEHPQEKYKVSKLEYSILEAYMDLSNCGSVKMLDFPVFNRLHELGYFKGATTDTYTRDYFENCEVKEDV